MSGVSVERIPARFLLGPYHAIERKIEAAKGLYEEFGEALLADGVVAPLLQAYLQRVASTWKEMERIGVTRICRRCALEDGGSCCGKGIENHFDAILLLINLLAGKELPESRRDPTGCWFLGEEGCTLAARHVLCVNYLCHRITGTLEQGKIQGLQAKILQESDAGFALEEAVKAWLLRSP